ncbi:sensor histidine kinase [Devosia sp. CN2-171]|uniref:sensor histidine kinase n=1 Tax=Devosia sp. CN2-171 TaxID=3400909 RepID=UPI003BF7836A
MIRLQLVTLALFFGLILVPIFALPMMSGARNVRPPDPSVLATIEPALTFESGGKLALHPTPALSKLVEKYPGFWFIAVAADESDVTFGSIPPEAQVLRLGLKDVVSMQVMLELESSSPTLLVRTVTMPGGTVKIATGGGPTLGVAGIIQAITLTMAITTFVVLAIASAIAVPRFIRAEMQGLSAAATAAGSIDVNQRGIRIPEAELPAEVLTLVRAVNAALERLDEAHSRRERFLADAAHELRTPIAVLLARIETADPFEGRQKLLADVTRLGELTNQLLDVQRLTISEPALLPFDLVELGAAVVADLAPLAIAAGYDLELEAPGTAVMVEADPGSLHRAVLNLVRNAISHGGNHGRIIVSVGEAGTIAVSDEGPGVPPGAEQRIFEPFHRPTPSSDGAGLGLSLVESIVRQHKGSIAVGRSPTGGARFTIMLPRQQ